MLGGVMSDDRPNPLADVTKGLGLLFRAARTAVSRLPKGDLEEAVVNSAREVGRAIENVASTLEREVLGLRDRRPRPGSTDGSGAPKGGEPAPKHGPDEPHDPDAGTPGAG
jgi:hypothetical protein